MVSLGKLSESDLQAALTYMEVRGVKLGRALTVMGFVTDADLGEALRHQGVQSISLEPRMVDHAVAMQLGASSARSLLALPIQCVDGTTTVAMEDPADTFCVEEIACRLGTPVHAVHAEPTRIQECIDEVFGVAVEEVAPALPRSPWFDELDDGQRARFAQITAMESGVIVVTGSIPEERNAILRALAAMLTSDEGLVFAFDLASLNQVAGIAQVASSSTSLESRRDTLARVLKYVPDTLFVGQAVDPVLIELAGSAAAVGARVVIELPASDGAEALATLDALEARPGMVRPRLRGILGPDSVSAIEADGVSTAA